MSELCTNCHSPHWGAKNDEYCNLCEYSWYSAFRQAIRDERYGENPKQSLADNILNKHNLGDLG